MFLGLRPSGPGERRFAQRGFTLIELLVVIVILGVLSAVVVFAVRGSGDKGRKAAVATDERTVRTALEAYCAQKGHYPADPAMKTLVDDKFLSSASTYHSLKTGTDRAKFPQGNCPGTGPNYYDLSEVKGASTASDALCAPTDHPVVTTTSTSLLPSIIPTIFPTSTQPTIPPSGSRPWDPQTWCEVAAPNRGVSGNYVNDTVSAAKMVQLADGKIFTGWEIFDPVAGSWARSTSPIDLSTANDDPYPQQYQQSYSPMAMVLLKDNPATPGECAGNCNKVLVYWAGNGTPGWELFDPAATGANGRRGSWSRVPVVAGTQRKRGDAARAVQIIGTAAECADDCGKVLVAGGNANPPGDGGPEAELYNPNTNTFALSDRYTTDNQDGVLVAPLPRGQVLVLAPDGKPPDCGDHSYCLRARVFDPIGDKFTEVARPPAGLGYSAETPTALPDGTVVFIWNDPDNGDHRNSIFHPAAAGVGGSWSEAAPCPDVGCHAISALSDGKLLATQINSDYAGRTWEFDPTVAPSGSWSRVGDTRDTDPQHGFPAGAILIANGPCGANCKKVLAVSPWSNPDAPIPNPLSAELYKPAS